MKINMLRFNLRQILNPNAKCFRIFSLNLSNQKGDEIKSKKKSDSQSSQKINSSNNFPDINANRTSVSVALIGGGITPAYAALLLKQEPIINSINIADVNGKSPGLFLDVSHVDTSTKIKYFKKTMIADAIRDVDIIALMNADDFTYGKSSSHAQFLASSKYVKNIAEKIVRSCPTALVAIFASPVTANLPLVSEIYKCAGRWDPNRIIGSLAIDTMRVEAMAANLFDLNPAFTSIPIVGGADPCTIVPLLSRAKPVDQFSIMQQKSLIRSLRASDNELAILNKGEGGPKLSMAAAVTKLIITLASGYCGSNNSIASAYVRSNVLPVCKFFANELKFGPGGVEKNFGLPKVSIDELELIEEAIPFINANVDLAMKFLHENENKNKKLDQMMSK